MLGKSSINYLELAIIIIVLLLLVYSSNNIGFASNFSSISQLSQINQNPITNAGIHVDNFPVGIAVNPLTNKIYVTNEYSNTVSVINGDNDEVEGTIFVGGLPYDLDVDPVTNKIYVSNLGTNTISVIDGETNKVVGDIVNVTTPVGLDVDSANGYVYVTSIDTNTVSKIDLVTNKVVNNITVGRSPYTVDIAQAAGSREFKVYVSNLGSNTVSVIDGNSSTLTLMENITVGTRPVGLAANPVTNLVYVANRGSDTVSVIDAVSNTVVKNLPVGKEPDGVDINFRTNMIYVTNTGSSTVSVIDNKTNDVIKEIKVNQNISPELLDLLQVKEEDLPPTVEFPNIASFVDVNQETNMIYVTNTGSSTVSVINGSTNELLVGLTFNINPPNSGTIECTDVQNNNNKMNIANQYIKTEYKKKFKCTAYPEDGSIFDFWSSNREGNETVSLRPSSPLSSIISWFSGLFSPQNSPPKEVNASEYDSLFIANFKAAPDYMSVLIVPVLLTAISFIILGIQWIYKKLKTKWNEKNYMNRHYMIIEDAYNEKMRNKEEAFQSLTQIRNDIRHDYHTGNIYDSDYKKLIQEIGKKMEDLNGSSTPDGAPRTKEKR